MDRNNKVVIGIPCPDGCGAVIGNRMEEMPDGTWHIFPVTNEALQGLKKRLLANPHPRKC
jgi:hypothetical protein